ncbi:response regulator [Pueribacillus sp. YX66]|uniref:response regulator n=1 Tax=Pueribacillus sp. YX66 TaxID=3229242 RepID=UPI00358CF79B
MKIKVLLVDDHLMFMLGIKQLLEGEKDLTILSIVDNPPDLDKIIKNDKPHVIVMDIRMKDYNGIELTKKITKIYPEIKIIILSGYNYDEYMKAAYEAGAYAFISKENSAHELANAIRESHKGNKLIVETKEKQLLTNTELEILKLISQDKTNSEISEILIISKRTVEHHVSSIINKLRVDSRVGAVVKGMKSGLINF